MSRKLSFSVGYSIPGIPEFIAPLTWKWILNSQSLALTLNPHPCVSVVPPWDLIHLSFYLVPTIMLGKPEALHKSFSSYAIKIWGKGLKMWWRRKWQPTPVFSPVESNGQKSLVGYSPCGHKESDTADTKWADYKCERQRRNGCPNG